MPFYDLQCKECQLVYEVMILHSKIKTVKCPECGSKKKEQVMAGCNFNFSNPVGTDRYTSESGGHDYRFHHNLPNVLAQRQAAELAAAGDTNPYNEINDFERPDAFGEVK